ncbi:MAG: O-antigen ligase family protein [Vulcanimicrobiaceae bacterium]
MATYVRRGRGLAGLLPYVGIVICGIVAGLAGVALAGTKSGTILALAATIGPGLLYAAIVSPIGFPFSLYAVLTPFDGILDMPAFGTLTKVIGIATGAALLFYMLRTRRFVQPDRSLAVWILFYLWMAASLFWAMDSKTSLQLLPTALQLFVLYLVASMFPSNLKSLRLAGTAVIAGGVCAASYGFYVFHSGVGLTKERLWIATDTSTLNPDHFANSLLLPLTLALVVALWTRSLWVRLAAIASITIMFVAIGLTGTRGALVAFLAILVYLMIRDRHRWQLGVLTAVAGVAVLATTGARLVARFQEAASTGGAHRVDIWRVGFTALRQHWLIGAGYGNFPFAYDTAFLSVQQTFFTEWHRASHNILLGTGVELGTIGLVLLIAAWYGQFRMLRNIGSEDARYPMRVALEAALIGLFVAAMFVDMMIWKYLWLAFILVAMTRNAIPPFRETRKHA